MSQLMLANHSFGDFNQVNNVSDVQGTNTHTTIFLSPDWLSMVLRLRQHNIGYTADGFYRSDDPTNSVKALKEGG